MKYYSEQLSRLFDTEDALRNAEEAANAAEKVRKEAEEKKAAERKDRAAEVEAARTAMVDATKKYHEVLEKFCKDYGAYHYSLKRDEIPDISDIFDPLRVLSLL